MRNAHLKTVRNLWKEYVLFFFVLFQFLIDISGSSARIFFSRSALLAKALGTTPEEEHRMGIHKLAKVRLIQLDLMHIILIKCRHSK